MTAPIDSGTAAMEAGRSDFVTVRVGGQLLGLPVLAVHDVMNAQKITPVPAAPSFVAGVLNLRGRIVTAIDLRNRLGLPGRAEGEKSMSVVVEHRGEPYSLLIDSVGEVLSLENEQLEKNPVTLSPRWREISVGIYRLDDELLTVIDVKKLLDFEAAAAA